METETIAHRGVRESRRQAMLARAIVEQHTHPLLRHIKRVTDMTRANPELAVVAAVAAGMVIGFASAGSRNSR